MKTRTRTKDSPKKFLKFKKKPEKETRLEIMAAENDRHLRIFKKASPCIRDGGCWKRVKAGSCTKDNLKDCYKSFTRMTKGSA